MPRKRKDGPLTGPELYRRGRDASLKVGDAFLSHEAREGSGSVKTVVPAGEWILEAAYQRRDGSPGAGMVALREFERAFGFTPREGQVCNAGTVEGEPVELRITRIRKTTTPEPTFTLNGGKVEGWGTEKWRRGCKEADESVDPLDAGAFGTGTLEDPLLLGLGLPDPFVLGAPSLSSLAKWRKADARRRAFGHPKDPAKSFRPWSLDKQAPGGTSLGELLSSKEPDPAKVALDAIEARRIRDVLDTFGRERPANAAAVERWAKGLSRKEAARRHPPATPKAVEKAEEKLHGLIARLKPRAG